MRKILLFDFDGTIADSFENFLQIIDLLSQKYNFRAVAPEELEELREHDIKTLMNRLHIPLLKLPFMARDMKQMQQKHIAMIQPFTGLPEVLQRLKDQGYTLGVLTSNAKDNVELFMKNNNITVFDYIFSDTSIFGKDKVIRKFISQNRLTKEDIIYVGDEIRDIQAAHKVGIPVIAVTWGFNSKIGLIKDKPDFVADKPDELLQITANNI